MAEPVPPDSSTPRWVKAGGIIGIAIIVLIVLALLTGRHDGPSRHAWSASATDVLARR